MPAQKPSEIHAIFLDAFNRGDVEGLVSLYEPGAVLIVDGKPAVGHEAIRRAYEGLTARRGRMELQTLSVVESADGLAVLHGGWTLTFPSAGGSMNTAQGLSTEVIRRQRDGTWLFLLDEPRTPTV